MYQAFLFKYIPKSILQKKQASINFTGVMEIKSTIAYSGKIPQVLLVLAITVLLVHHFFAYTGHYGYDDMHYARLANMLLQGVMNYEDHYSFRWPIILLTALSFQLFGISDHVSAVPALCMSIGTLIFVYRILRPYGSWALGIGLGITVFDGWSLHYSDKIMPDIYINLAMIGLLYCIYTYKYVTSDKRSLWLPFGFAFWFIFGFMAKETMLLVLPLLAFWIMVDVLKKRDLFFWKWSVFFFLLFLAVYTGIIYLLTGSVSQRYTALLQNPYLSLCSYSLQSKIILCKRIGFQFYELLISKGMFVSIGILIVAIYHDWKKDLLWFKESSSFFYVSIIVLLLSCNFMSTSLENYNPLCLDPRHYMFLIPVSAIPVAIFLNKHLWNKQILIGITIVFFIISVISYFNSISEFTLLYCPLFLLFASMASNIRLLTKSALCLSLFSIVLSFKLVDKIRYASTLNYKGQMEIIKSRFLSGHYSGYIITDEVQKRLIEYYSGFTTSNDIQCIKFDSINFDTLAKEKSCYVLLNQYTMQLSNLNKNELPYFVGLADSSQYVYRNPELNIEIIKLDLLKTPVLLKEFKFGFEPNDGISISSVSNLQMYSGGFSNRVEEYSYTFEYYTDSISSSCSKLVLKYQSAFYKEKSSVAAFVVSLDNGGAPYLYHSVLCDHYIKAYSNWAIAKFNYMIPMDSIRRGSILKIYVWNPDKELFYMDDLEIRMLCTD
jgi:hypothetical protein